MIYINRGYRLLISWYIITCHRIIVCAYIFINMWKNLQNRLLHMTITLEPVLWFLYLFTEYGSTSPPFTWHWRGYPLHWRHNRCDGVSNHQPHDCLPNRLFRRRSKKTSKVRVTGLCAGKSSVAGEFLAQMASNAEYISIWWRHHA